MKIGLKQSVFCISAAALMMLSGCSDDSSKKGSDGQPSGQPETKCSAENCASPKQCIADKCVVPVAEGGDCSAPDSGCSVGQCVDGVCVKHDSKNCSEDKDCSNGASCQNSICVTTVAAGESCAFEDTVCGTGQCVEKVCRLSEGESCTKSEECLTTLYCSGESKCAPKVGIGEACTDDSACRDNMTCEDICVRKDVKNGEECNLETLQCEGDMYCDGTVCVSEVKVGEACDDTHLCAEGDCYSGECLMPKGDCSKDEECGQDTYCCTEDACSVKNVCLAYGTGPRGDVNEACVFTTKEGEFEAAIQCEWKDPAGNGQTKSLILVADTPYDSGNASEIILHTFTSPKIRFFNAENCELHGEITVQTKDANSLSVGDIDNDGKVEVVSMTQNGSLEAYHWDEASKGYTKFWTTSGCQAGKAWGGASIHDINDDGQPELLLQHYVINGKDGKCLNSNQKDPGFGSVAVAGDFDGDKKIEAITQAGVVRWDSESNSWKEAYKMTLSGTLFAFADFGTPGESEDKFDFTKLDGRAEIVVSGGNTVDVYTLEGQKVMSVATGVTGAPTVGDFDNDKLPEIALASKTSFGVYDPRCVSNSDECKAKYTLWTVQSNDNGSDVTSSSLFDFDGDGQAEAVFSDSCYTRVFNGKTGEVLFSSAHLAQPSYEFPTIADVDGDDSVEIVIGTDSIAPNSCDNVDQLHAGIKCSANGDCYSGSCVKGYCRCTSDDQCNWQTDASGKIMKEYMCTDSILSEVKADGKVCRAYRSGEVNPGLHILRDRLDRWVSSRPIWNQHAYSITNVNDNGSIPKTSDWVMNFTSAGMNNYRENQQGTVGANKAPDITGNFTGSTPCQTVGSDVVLNANVCNRGTKKVATLMPATFYKVEADETRTLLCTSYTTENVPVGGCLPVSCKIDNEVSGKIVLVVNDDGKGGKTTVECNESNNEDSIVVEKCVN